jgi:uncharacterized protein YpmB
MNELFEFHKELNLKKILIVIAILLIIIFLIIFVPKTGKEIKEKQIENAKPNSTFSSTDNSINIELSKKYEFTEYIPAQDYILELRSSNKTNIFVSKKSLYENKTLESVVSADKNSYISKFKSYSNLSNITELVVNGFPAYTYSFHYLNKKSAYYLQIFWIETESGYYVIDVEFPLNSLNDNHVIINDLVNNFKISPKQNA